jgi:multidrug efflux pump subunit AcrB
VLATTLSLVVIFGPVSFMSSISGRFLDQFGVTAAAAVLVRLLVSFTLTPMMASRMLRRAGGAAGGGHGASRAGFYRYIGGAFTQSDVMQDLRRDLRGVCFMAAPRPRDHRADGPTPVDRLDLTTYP